MYKIFRGGRVTIIRYIKIKSSANPFDKENAKYFSQRCKDLKIKSEKTKQICIFKKEFNQINLTLLNLWKQKAG